LRGHGSIHFKPPLQETKDGADIAKVLTEDEARRIAVNIAKLPASLGKGS
jgi:hypothetical protein